MSDDLVKRLTDHIAVFFDDKGHVFEDETLCDEAADRIEELEAKLSESEALLAKAVEAIEFWSQAQEPEIDAAINIMQATLAELKNPKDSMKGEK